MKKKRLAQSSMEYMMVVGFALLMIFPIIAIYGIETNNVKQDVSSNQAYQISRKITDSANKVYYLGEPSKTTLTVYMPKNVKKININGREIVFVTETGAEIVSVAEMNMTGTLKPEEGIQTIVVEAHDNYVLISEG